MEKKIRKGDLVRVNEAICFTQQNGGTRPYPVSYTHLTLPTTPYV